MICLENNTCIFFKKILSWLLHCFFCLYLPYFLFLAFSFFSFFLPPLHPLPGSEPNPKANERIEKDWIFANSWGSQDGPNGLSPPLSLTPQLSPKSEHLPPLQTHSSKAQGRWGIHCVGMALLLWKPMLRNLSELIHCGEQPSLGGGGEAKL